VIDNIRFALRQLQKNPGFATLAIITLALGIGANTAMFTVIDSVMLRPLPFRNADRVVAITTGAATTSAVSSTSWPNYRDIREQARQLSAVAAYTIDFGVVRTSQSSQPAVSVKTTASLFEVLGVRPALGRAFLPSDNQPGAAHVILLTSNFWREHFAADPHVLGQEVHIGDEPYTVVGILPAGLNFSGSDASSGVWIPYQPDPEAEKERNSNFLYLLGSLRPGVSLNAAQAELSSMARGIAAQDPEHAKDLNFHLVPFRDVITRQVKPVFLALTAALILVLLIACANVANLQLSRCLSRSQELAVRTALGASRSQLLKQMLTEGGVLCAIGAAVGVALADLMLSAVHHLPPDLVPRADEIHLRLSVFLMLLATAIVVTLLSSIAPAVVAMRSDPQSVLQEASRGSSAGPRRSRLSAAMVAGEVALSVVLLVSGGLMFRTLYKLQHLYLGFDANSLTKFIALPGSTGGFFNPSKSHLEDQNSSLALRVYQPMADKLRHLPGVVDAAFSNAMPFETIDMGSGFRIVGRTDLEKLNARLRAISAGYARVMRTPVLHGRAINEEDTATSPKVVAVNETFAKRIFPGQNAVGQQVIIGGKDTDLKQPYTIIGVMADSVQDNVSQSTIPEIDFPYPQIPVTSFFYNILVAPEANYVVRTQGPVEVVSAIRNLFHESHPDFALDEFITMSDARDQSDFSQRMGLYLIGSFAGIAVVMVLAGLYGVLSQFVGQRRREIGIRMALGADRASILNMILRRGLVLIGLGLGIGLLASAATEQSLRSFLFGVSPLDVWTYLGVTMLLIAVGVLAALIPARRAACTEPTHALRAE